MEIFGIALAVAAILVAVALHLWTRADQRRQREAEQNDVGELKGEISEIRAATTIANRLAGEALDEAKKAHTQRAELTEHQLAQTLLPRIAELDKDGAQACYLIGLLDLANQQNHRPMAIKGREEVVFAVRTLKEQYLAGKVTPQQAESELRRIGECYDELTVYLKQHKR